MDIRTLAQHLDLSIGTVSRALNGKTDVNAETRIRVIEAAKEYGYAPNQSGRALRRGRTGSVGFILTLAHDSALHGAPFFMGLFEGVQAGLSDKDFDLVVLLARDGEDQLDFLRRNVSRGIADGWLLSATQRHDPRIDFLLEHSIPFATLGRSASGGTQPWIDLDFESMVQQAMDVFLNAGHRRIGLIAPPATVNNSYIVIDTYIDKLASAGLPYDHRLIHQGDASESDGEAAAHYLMSLDNPPTSLLVMGETAPVGVYKGLRTLGLTPGQDLAVIGSRQNPATIALNPSLTCFTLSLHDLGVALAGMLGATLNVGNQTQSHQLQKLWPMNMVEGVSHLCNLGDQHLAHRQISGSMVPPKK